MGQALGQIRLADAPGARDHPIDRTEGLASEQRTGQADPGEDRQRHAQEEPSAGPQHRVGVVQGHGHLDGVASRADGHRERDHPHGFLAEIGHGREHRLAVAHARQERGRRRQTSGPERRTARHDSAVQIGDLHELVEPRERGRPRAGRHLVDADRLRGIDLERSGFRRGEPEDRVVDHSAHDHPAERPVRAERRERQHDCQDRDVPEPEPRLEGERPHASGESGGPSR